MKEEKKVKKQLVDKAIEVALQEDAKHVKRVGAKYNHLSKEDKIAIMCYEANKTWLELHGDASLPEWADVPKWHKESIQKGIEYKIGNPTASAGKMHNVWMEYRISHGWEYGEKLDEVKKLHPNLVPFNDLSDMEQKKQILFSAIVDALK